MRTHQMNIKLLFKEIRKILHRYMISYFIWGDIKWISDFYSKKLEKYYTDIWFLTFYEGVSKEQLKYILYLYHGRYGVLIHDLYPNVRAIFFTVTPPFPFTASSTAPLPSGVTTGCAWPGRGQSVTELTPFMTFPVHSYTCCSDRHASPYWTFIRRWIWMYFAPFTTQK